MSKAKNKVIAGDYLGSSISSILGEISILTGITKSIFLNKTTVKQYELITDEIRKSGKSAILRGGIGAALIGPVGLLAGLTAKQKGIYQVAIEFTDGKKSLIEIDDKIYKALIKKCF